MQPVAQTQSATQRTLDILEALADAPDGLPLVEIATRLAMPKSIAHRLLALLSERGYARQDGVTGHYVLTLKLTLLGARHLAGTGLGDVAQPIIERLAAATGELARLTVVDGERLAWVAKAQGARHGLRYDPDAGTHVVLHATATGKAWLATMPDREALRIVEAAGFQAPDYFGPNVVRDAKRLLAELKATRARGHGLAIEEGAPGTAAMAVVVRASSAATAQVVGTLSLAGPVTRFTPEARAGFLEQLVAASRELSALWPLRTPLGGPRPIPKARSARADQGVGNHVLGGH